VAAGPADAAPSPGRTVEPTWKPAAVVLAAAAAQALFVVGRYSFSAALGNPMGGAAQAKAYFPALLPLALLFTWGLAGAAARWGRGGDRTLALSVLAWLLALDGVSLALTLWHHYRWWQVMP
jgi:hypothetical protein